MNEKLIAFLDKYGLKGQWSRGDDDGGIDSFSTETEPSPEDAKLVDMHKLQKWIYKKCLSSYGSWAGEYDAYGTISYDRDEQKIAVDGSEGADDMMKEHKKPGLHFPRSFSRRISSVFLTYFWV